MATWMLLSVLLATPAWVRPCPDVADACEAVFDWTRCACLEGRIEVEYSRGLRVAPVAEGHAVWVGAELVVVVDDAGLGPLLRAVAEGADATELSAAGWKVRLVSGT